MYNYSTSHHNFIGFLAIAVKVALKRREWHTLLSLTGFVWIMTDTTFFNPFLIIFLLSFYLLIFKLSLILAVNASATGLTLAYTLGVLECVLVFIWRTYSAWL